MSIIADGFTIDCTGAAGSGGVRNIYACSARDVIVAVVDNEVVSFTMNAGATFVEWEKIVNTSNFISDIKSDDAGITTGGDETIAFGVPKHTSDTLNLTSVIAKNSVCGLVVCFIDNSGESYVFGWNQGQHVRLSEAKADTGTKVTDRNSTMYKLVASVAEVGKHAQIPTGVAIPL